MKISTHVPHPFFAMTGARSLILLVSACLAFSVACDSGGSGDTPDNGNEKPNPETPIADEDYGEACQVDSDCESGFCTTVSSNSDDAFCSYPCADDNECPQEEDDPSSCIFVERNERLAKVCAPDDLCIDRDNDGYGTGPGCLGRDCDDNNPLINPGAVEACDGLDNNCDGLVDVNVPGMGEDCDTGLYGVCGVGRWVCEQGQETCIPNIQPNTQQEICDGLDNDCDGAVDEGAQDDTGNNNYVIGIGQVCGSDGSGCFEGIYTCDSVERTLYCDGDVVVTDQDDFTCDYIDDNCNGEIDEDYRAQYSQFGTRCEIGEGACRSVGVWDCHPTNPHAPPVCNALSNDHLAKDETCNYFDDDCDGIVDTGFVNADGIYDHVEYCGNCATNCNRQWADGPDANNAIAECVVTGGNAACSFTCKSGFVDFNGLRGDGCELEVNYDAIYVASADRGGEDSSNCGTYDVPCTSIAHSISRAKAEGATQVLVGEGTFDGGFTLEDSLQILGGHSSTTWDRDPNVNLTALRGGVSDGTNSYGVRIQNISGAKSAEFSGFTVEAPDARNPSGNSIGIWVINSDNGLVIQDNTILAGRGGTGAPGSGGSDGSQGGSGGDGHDRMLNQTSCNETGGVALAGGAAGQNTCGSANVSGGSGASTNCPSTTFGAIGPNNGRAGQGQGSANTDGRGAAGQSPYHYRPTAPEHDVFGCQIASNQPVASPTPGLRGGVGSDGTRGLGATNVEGSINGFTWRGQDGGDGSSGTSGAGGGGGGSSGGIFQNLPGFDTAYHYGATGGGGGAGGCGATGGQGGRAGGGSFGMLVVGSGSSFPVIENNELHRGSGGRGGQGGIGGVGGDGGAGGAGGQQIVDKEWSRCGQHAADGGAGGRGGHGGGAGGGAGGVAYDIAISGYSSADVSGNQFAIPDSMKTGGIGGKGGSGIHSSGTNGASGASGSVLEL